MVKQSPELFPQAMSGGFRFHSLVTSRKQRVQVRRIELKTTGAVDQIRPSFVIPSMIGKTDEVEKALYFCQWGVPFEALAYGFGRDAHYWYRAALSLGRPSLAGTTVKAADRLLNTHQYFNGTSASARLLLRSMALIWNFHPYSGQLRHDQPHRISPFHDLNGFQYHSNWFHNLLIAASMDGHR